MRQIPRVRHVTALSLDALRVLKRFRTLPLSSEVRVRLKLPLVVTHAPVTPAVLDALYLITFVPITTVTLKHTHRGLLRWPLNRVETA